MTVPKPSKVGRDCPQSAANGRMRDLHSASLCSASWPFLLGLVLIPFPLAPAFAAETPLIDKSSNPLIQQPLTASQTEFFENRIRPILANHCYKCHSAESPKV